MILHWIEAADATRHVHHPSCDENAFAKEDGDVWEIELPDDADEDEIIATVWDDIFGDENPTDEELDTYGEMTVFRACTDSLFPDDEADEAVDSSGNPKADEFMDEAEDAGWLVEFGTDEELVHVKASRQYIGPALRTDEVLELTWSATRLEDAHYLSGLPGEVAKRVSSVAGARKYLTAPTPKAKPQSTRQVGREQPVKRELKVVIPFDIENAYDDEIIAAVQGHWLVWWNNTAEDYERHFCIPQKNHIKIETGTAGRAILTFVSPEGFRSVALEELVQVK